MSAIEQEDRPLESELDDSDPQLAEFERMKKDVKAAERARGPWRKEADECFGMVAGHQWDPDDQRILEEEDRPSITFNRTEPLINAVCGLEVNNRQSVVYLPREVNDSGFNEMITNTGKWLRDEAQAEDEESDAFRDLVICGEGWTDTYMSFDEDPRGVYVEERVDPTEMGVNKGAHKANYQDARLVYRIRRGMDPDDVRALVGLGDDVLDHVLDANWLESDIAPADGGQGNKKDYPEKTREAVMRRGRGGLAEVTVIHCQYWKREPINMVATAMDAEPQEMSDEDFAKFQTRAQQIEELTGRPFEYSHARTMRRVYYECFLGSRILGEIKKRDIQSFQFKAMTGMRDKKKKCFYGMVRGMTDPQRWGNKWLSQTMHIMNTNAKGGLLAETDAFVDVKKAETDWADSKKIVWVKPGSLSKKKVQPRVPSPLPQGLAELLQFAISSIRDVTGVNLELLGQADREQAASLEAQRRQSAMTVLAKLFDSLRRYRKDQGKLTLQFIWMIPDGTMVRVNEAGATKYIPLMKDNDSIEKYDVVIDQAPSSPDQKQYVWAITAQILQMNILPPQAIIELLKYSPYPESVVLEIRKALGLDGQPSPEQLSTKLQQAEEALKFMEQKLTEAMEKAKTAEDDLAVEMLKLEVDEYKAETDRLRAQWDARIKMAGALATGAQTDISAQDANTRERSAATADLNSVVTTGEQELPDAGGGQSSPNLEQKLDQLTALVMGLAQALQPPQAGAAPPPVEQM